MTEYTDEIKNIYEVERKLCAITLDDVETVRISRHILLRWSK